MLTAAAFVTTAVVAFVLGRLSARRTTRNLREALDWRIGLTDPPKPRRPRRPPWRGPLP